MLSTHRSSDEPKRSAGSVHRVEVEVLRGENLIACDINGKSDPYFVASWVDGGGNSSAPIKSPFIHATLSPDWEKMANEKGLNLKMTADPLSTTDVGTLHVEIWDRDKMSKDDFMGQCDLTLSPEFLESCDNKPTLKSMELLPRPDKKDKVRGSIVFRISYFSPGTLRRLAFQAPSATQHTLEVIVVKGEKLKAMDANGKSDPFFKARWVGGVGDRTPEMKSPVIPGTLNPNWSAQASLKGATEQPMRAVVANTADFPVLEVEVWDQDIGRDNDFMGCFKVDPSLEGFLEQDGVWQMAEFLLGARESKGGTIAKRMSGIVRRSSSHVSGSIFVKYRYTSPEMQRKRLRKIGSSRAMLAESPQLEHLFERPGDHPLVIIAAASKDHYERAVNAVNANVATRTHTRKATTYNSSFEGHDAVDALLLHLQSHADWDYDEIIGFFRGEEREAELEQEFDATHAERCRQYIIKNTLGESDWNREDACALLQKMVDDRYIRRLTAGPPVFKDAKTLYSFESPGMVELEELRKETGEKSIGRAFRAKGCGPKYPVVLIPGLASTALEVWDSEEAPEWLGERVWIDVNKIGSLAQVQKVKNMLRSKKEDDAPGRKWLRHLCLLDDGYSDPPGIKTRPCQGLGAIDYLSHNALTKGPTYVWSFVIRALIDMGYDRKQMIAAPYDWRLPPNKLEERDGFFSDLKCKVKQAHEANGERVVLIGHSMGCRATQWFLWWLHHTDPGFLKEHVHAFMALGPPFLGAAKLLRGSVTGDALGLDMFLQLKEGLHLAQRLGSLPWLLPLHHSLFTNPIARVRAESTSDSSSKDYPLEAFDEVAPFEVMKEFATIPWSIYEQNYRVPWYLADSEHMGACTAQDGSPLPPEQLETEKLPPILQHPPVDNLWCIYGVNLNTETAYYFKRTKGGGVAIDRTMDRESGRATANNPSALKIASGIGYETSDTAQAFLDGQKRSGDGTLPYSSMAYARKWQKEGKGGNVDIIEVPGADHREMMSDDRVIYHMLYYLSHGENPSAEHPTNLR